MKSTRTHPPRWSARCRSPPLPRSDRPAQPSRAGAGARPAADASTSAREVPRRGRGAPARAQHRGRPRAVGAADLHHRRHRDSSPPRRSEEVIAAGVELRQGGDALRRRRSCPPTCARKLDLLKRGLVLPAPARPGEDRRAGAARRRARRACTAAASTARRGQPATECLDLEELSRHPRREPRLRRSCSRPGPAGTRSRRRCAPSTQRLVELANEGARELGFTDIGALWRSKYDMPPDAFAARARPPVGPGQAALRRRSTATSRAKLAREVRRQGGAARRADPGAPARQHVGAALGQHLRPGRRRRRRPAAST